MAEYTGEQRDFDLRIKYDKNPALEESIEKTIKFAEELSNDVIKKCCQNTAGACSGNSNPDDKTIKQIVEDTREKNELFENKSTTLYTCPEDIFVLEHYIENRNTEVFDYHLKNMKKLYEEILMPIYNYYNDLGRFGSIKNGCRIAVIRGIMSSERCRQLFGNPNSNHSKGKSLDFRFINIKPSEVVYDAMLEKFQLPDNCEIFLLSDSVHIGYDDNRIIKNIDVLEREEII